MRKWFGSISPFDFVRVRPIVIFVFATLAVVVVGVIAAVGIFVIRAFSH